MANKQNQTEPSNREVAGLGGLVLEIGADLGAYLTAGLGEIAVTHSSWAAEHPGSESNERMEFLGDAVLGCAVAQYLYRTFPNINESQLSKRRAALVSGKALAEIGHEIGIGALLRLGKGEAKTGGAMRESNLADAVEAMFGALYLSTDYETTEKFILRLLAKRIERVERLSFTLDPKTVLQETVHKHGGESPVYEITESGEPGRRVFSARVEALKLTGFGAGNSKKDAAAAAAEDLVTQLYNIGRIKPNA